MAWKVKEGDKKVRENPECHWNPDKHGGCKCPFHSEGGNEDLLGDEFDKGYRVGLHKFSIKQKDKMEAYARKMKDATIYFFIGNKNYKIGKVRNGVIEYDRKGLDKK